MKFIRHLKENWDLKLIAFVIAVALWYYVHYFLK